MRKIEKIWQEIESETSIGSGIVRRRYASRLLAPLFIAIRRRDLKRCLVIDFQERNSSKQIENIGITGIEIELIENTKGGFYLLLLLSHSSNNDVFASLAEDLILSMENDASEEKTFQLIHKRLLIWKRIFESILPAGLNPEAQAGLFAELSFLEFLLNDCTISVDKAIKSWIGPESGNRDFEIDGWAVEVKATRSNRHQKIIISNERQLDDSFLDHLFLCHTSLEVQFSLGLTLNQKVAAVRMLLEKTPSQAFCFENKLILVGYLNKHNERYDEKGYQIRDINYYRIAEDFPCLKEKDIPLGVGDVKYSIMTSSLEKYIVPFSSIIETLK